MTSGVKPWTRQLDLCDRWLEIIIEEIKLRSHEISPRGQRLRRPHFSILLDARRDVPRGNASVRQARHPLELQMRFPASSGRDFLFSPAAAVT
jgi:hypothetical protein